MWGDVSRSWAGVIERDEEAQAGARPRGRLEETGSCSEEVLVREESTQRPVCGLGSLMDVGAIIKWGRG